MSQSAYHNLNLKVFTSDLMDDTSLNSPNQITPFEISDRRVNAVSQTCRTWLFSKSKKHFFSKPKKKKKNKKDPVYRNILDKNQRLTAQS